MACHISKMGYFKCTILFNICTISFLSYYDIGCIRTMFMVLLIFAQGNFKIGAMKPIFLDYGFTREEGGGFVRVWAWFVIIATFIYQIQVKTLISLSLTMFCAELCSQTT